MNTRPLLAAMMFAASLPAGAAEVQFEGFYQMRGRLFDTLSLRRTGDTEGMSAYMQHRLWLRPKFFVTDQVAMIAEVRGLDGVLWGNRAITLSDPIGDTTLFSDQLSAPVSEVDAAAVLSDFTLWRAWGEVDTRIGTFKFGRQPIHWGKGIWQNDGLGSNMDYGDSADRLSWEHLISNVWLRAGVDINVSNLINEQDNTTSYHISAAYRTERMEGGLQLMYRRSVLGDEAFDLFIIDGAFDLEFGPIDLEGEVVAQLGGGALENIPELRVTRIGAVIDAGLNLPKWRVRVEAGLATGDGQEDTSQRTFTFDRDYNIGLFMFEQPMPVLQSAVASEENGGRNDAVVLTGNAVRNVLYLKPSFAYQPINQLWVRGSFLAARSMKVTQELVDADRRSYGYEINIGADYEALDHFSIGGTFGVFVPGSYYRNYENDTYSTLFNRTAFGGQLLGRIEF